MKTHIKYIHGSAMKIKTGVQQMYSLVAFTVDVMGNVTENSVRQNIDVVNIRS